MADERNDYREFERREPDFTEPWNDGYREETAAEVSDVRPTDNARDSEEDDITSDGMATGAGMFGIVLSILSLFFLPILLGLSGIIEG